MGSVGRSTGPEGSMEPWDDKRLAELPDDCRKEVIPELGLINFP